MLGDYLRYDPDTGKLYWLDDRHGAVRSGDEAGCFDVKGYRIIEFLGKAYKAHRVAWYLHYGSWPEKFIDHINGNKSDNRITNLRDVTRGQNRQNIKKAYGSNKTGFLGVCYKQGKYLAQIKSEGKKRYLGYFSTPEEAAEAYWKAKKELHISQEFP